VFSFQIDRRVSIRCFDAGVAEPVADGYEIDTSTQEMDCRAVSTISSAT
jgi:hypothetical protein